MIRFLCWLAIGPVAALGVMASIFKDGYIWLYQTSYALRWLFSHPGEVLLSEPSSLAEALCERVDTALQRDGFYQSLDWIPSRITSRLHILAYPEVRRRFYRRKRFKQSL